MIGTRQIDRRLVPSGSPGDPDIFGAQQYAPLLDIDVPVD